MSRSSELKKTLTDYRPQGGLRDGFTLIDTLVSMAVIMVLISISAPSISSIAEAARKVRCASNMHQVGLGLVMWAGDHKGKLPDSVFAQIDPDMRNPRNMMLLHLGEHTNDWDGLGFLFADNYLSSADVFYCPSHFGNHPKEMYDEVWTMLTSELIGNYQSRILPSNINVLEALADATTLLTDGMRTRSDYNHKVGNNMLKADMSVSWYRDSDSFISNLLPERDAQIHKGFGELGVWSTFDFGVHHPDPNRPNDNGGNIASLRRPSLASPQPGLKGSIR